MSIPAENADTQGKPGQEQPNKAEPTFADRVNELANTVQPNEKGELEFDENVSEELKFAVTSEIRRRDTQRSFTKARQEAAALKAEKSVLLNKVTSEVKLKLTPAQETELEELKFSDPEAWRKKMNSLEEEARTNQQKELDEEIKKVSTSNLDAEEIERRKVVLKQFQEAHKGFVLDDETIANDIPPRITKKLATGDITFEEFLQECFDYTTSGKVIKQTKVSKQVNMSKLGGGDSPELNAVKTDINSSYEKETY